jgi:hypothetical protein
MRQTLIDYYQGLGLRGYKVSEELPFDSNDLALYTKNPKTVYVDQAQTTVQAFIAVLNGSDVESENTTLRVYLATDAKRLPADYDTVITSLRGGRNISDFELYFQRDVNVTTSYDQDLMITEMEFTFIRLI